MKFLFLGTLYDKKYENDYLNKSKIGLQGAANTFQWNLIDGIDACVEEDDFTIYNTIPMGTYPKYYKELIIKSKEWSHREKADDFEIGYINLPIIKQLSRYYNYKKAILKWIKSDNEPKAIILYSLYLPIIIALRQVKKRYPETKISIIVTDIDGEYGILPKNPISAVFVKKYGKNVIDNIEFVDSFVLLTDAMKIPLKIKDKPYIVVEGIASEKCNVGNSGKHSYSRGNKKIILYTGTLLEEYGIRSLLEAFEKIDNVEYELWICGSGGIENEISSIVKRDNRIKFYGYVSKEKIIDLHQQATILINPRTNEGNYIKYSFPSKTMEYMISGKPVIMYKLYGIPDEYDDFLYYVKDNTVDSLKNTIIEICNKSNQELDVFGNKAKEFVLKEKNSSVQAKKIIEMIKMS